MLSIAVVGNDHSHVSMIIIITFVIIISPVLILSVFSSSTLPQILPRWDWTRVYYSDCFISNPYYVSRSLLEDDCNVGAPGLSVRSLTSLENRVYVLIYLESKLYG